MEQKYLDILTNIIGAVESGGQIYGKRNYGAYAGRFKNSDKEYTCTLGWAQNYGNEAKKLCNMIFSADPAAFKAADSAGIEGMLSRDWVKEQWDPTPAQKEALIAIITTPAGKQCQDTLFQQLMETYIKHAQTNGVTEVPAQMMWCEIEHQGGLGPVKRIFGRAQKPYTPDTILASLLLDQQDTSNNNQVGDKKFQKRHELCAQWIKQYVMTDYVDPIKTLLDIALGEEGYLEKKSNAQLDDKTANVGSNNYTKYARDVAPSLQAQPWCDMFVDWCFERAFGRELAQKVTYQTQGYSAYTPTSAQYYKNNNHWSASPQVGAQIFFRNTERICHTGIVTKVDATTVYTIEGNTNNGNTVVANGGAVCQKSYPISYADIAGYGIPAWELIPQKQRDKMGWNKNETGWWYVYDNKGSYYKDEWGLINHYWYLFNKDGYMKTGWHVWKDEWYYLDTTEGETQGQCWHETSEHKGALEPWYVEY